MDVGWNNTAAVFLAIDPDSEVVYVTSDYKRGNCEPVIHAQAIKQRSRGANKVGVVDPASRGRSQHDGQQLLQIYREMGLNICPADNAVEAGLYTVWQMLATGKLKVFRTCIGLLQEIRVYRRDERGKIVKENDHIMDAMRYSIMSGIAIAENEEVKLVNFTIDHQAGGGSWLSV
jgi:hypothetical protein